jgi:hypothetical protein
MDASRDVSMFNDDNPGVFRPDTAKRQPQQPPNEVLKAYRFSAKFTDGPFEPFSPGLISVSGLRFSNEPGYLVVSRGVIPGNSEFAYWIRNKYKAADLEIIVDSGLVFVALTVQPVELVYNDLDAGGSNNHILIETVKLTYQSLHPEFHVIKEEK